MTLAFYPNRKEFELFLDTQLRLVRLEFSDIAVEAEKAYVKIAAIFSSLRVKNFNDDKGPVLCVAHNAQYSIFLYELSRAVFDVGARDKADKIYALLRMVSGADIYYEVKLPDLWGCDHPLGSVIGRGQFGPASRLFFSQNSNIGNNRGIYPRINGNLLMMPNSSLLGDTEVEGRVILSNGACAMDAKQLKDCVVFGRSPDLIIKPLSPAAFAAASAFSNS